MSFILPPVIAIKAPIFNTYLNYTEESELNSLVKFTGGNVFSRTAKFEVLTANTGRGLVHIRCSHNKKFLRVRAQGSEYISPDADEPEEDQSKWSCTLFEPRPRDGFTDRVYLFHVQRQLYAVSPIFDRTYYLQLGSTNQENIGIMEIIDHESLLILPRHVSFKGPNGKYLGTVELNHLGFTLQFLAFHYTAKGQPETWFEVSNDGHGRAQFLSRHTNTFWRSGGYENWILSDITTFNNNSGAHFWPLKVNNNTIALRNTRNNNFCSQMALNNTTDCLSAAYSSITSDSRLVMEELVLSRRIYNADFDLANAIIYGETPVAMATANASNNTDAENTIEFKLIYTESRSSTWSTTHSWMVGMSVSVSFRIPFIGGGEVTTSGEFAQSYDWGETITTENTLETTYSVIVPPRTTVSVRLMATTGTCDVPYSYYQRDVLYNGQTVVYSKDDGLYTGINSYNFHYEVTTLTQGRSDAVTVEHKIPNPLTGLSLLSKAQVLQQLTTSEVTTQEPNLPLSAEEATPELILPLLEEATQDVGQPLEETIQEIPKLSLSPGV